MRRILKWVALGTATVLVVLMALLLSLPLLLDSESVKAAALQHLSRATGGQWRVAHLELDWLPAPKIGIQGASFSIPGSVEGKVEALTLTTALVPLLWGDVRLSNVALVAPDITVTLAPTPASAADSGPFTVSDLRAALASISRLKAVDLRSLEFVIERGRFVLASPGQASLSLTQISGRAAHRSGRFEADVTTASDVAQRIDAKISLDAERFEGSIQIDATGIDLATLLAVAGVQGVQLQGLALLRAQIAADSSPALRGTFNAGAPSLSIASGDSKLDVQAPAIVGEAQWTDGGLRIAAQDIHAATPVLQAAAVLSFSPDWKQQRLEAKVQSADLETVKQLVLPWTVDTPEVAQYAEMVKAGQLSGLEATLQLDQIEQWYNAIEARGTVSGVAMALKQPEIPIRDLGATLVLAQGKLTAEGVQAATGNSTVRNGRISLDFAAAPMAVAATAQWQADLSQVLALLKRQLAPRDRAKLDTLRTLAGDARGNLSLNGTFERLHILVEADSLRAQASLEQLPWPIQVTGAKVRVDGGELVVQRLAGNVGQSSFGPCSGQLTLAAGSRLQVSSCDADLALVELFDWVSKRFELPAAAKGLRVLAGRGLVQARTIAANLAQPARWSGDISVTPKALRLAHPELPGELGLDGGSIRGDLGALTIQRVKVEVLDTTLQVSGSVSGLRDGKPSLDVQATGPVDEKILAWGWRRAGLDHAAAHIAPFEARPVALRWTADSGFETRGDLVFEGKTSVGFDALIQPGKLDVRKLTVRDEYSNAQMSVRWQQGVLEGSFSGNVAGTSLIRIRQSGQSPGASMSGNLTYRVPIKRPRDFRANGQLRIRQITSPVWLAEQDLTLRSVALTAAARSLQLATSFSLRDQSFDVSGTIRGTDQRYALDLDVKSDSVDVNRLLGARATDSGQSSEEHPMSWDFPVEGRVRLALQAVRHGPYRVEPLIATVDIAPGRINLAVKQAKLCGIGIAGGGRAQPGTVSIDVVLRARDLDAQPALLCLTKERAIVTGRLDGDGHFTAAGPFRELPQRLTGPFHGIARDGRVDRLGQLAQVLDLVNASELLRGDKLNLSGTGFAYDKLEATGRLEKGVVQLDAVVLDAQPFDMVAHGSVDWVNGTLDMNVAVAPVQVLNSVVKLIPFLGYVLGGGVYAIPVGVRGKLSDPEIVPVAPTAVAGNILGMLERTLKTPFNLRQALVPPAMQGAAAAPSPALAPPAPAPKQ